MVSRKIEKARYGPGMGEVILGASLSILLGAVLAVAYLVWRPVQVVRELPKNRPFGAVYLVEGPADYSNGGQWMRKQQLFTGGTSVEVSASELNAWYAGSMNSGSGEAASAKKNGAADMINLGPPHFRIHGGRLEITSRGNLNLAWLGVQHPIIVQVTGHFARRHGEYALVADRFYLGSCPLHMLPVIGQLVLQHLLGRHAAPKDVAEAWKKLSGVSIADGELKLTMP